MSTNTESLRPSTNLDEYRKAGGGDNATNQRIIGQLLNREVGPCISSLVTTIASVAAESGKFGETDHDEILNLMEGQPDYESAASEEGWVCIDEIHESLLRAVYDHVEGATERDGESGDEWKNDGYPDDLREELRFIHEVTFVQLSGVDDKTVVDTSAMEDWEQLCDDQYIEPERSEVYEHWIVSSWAEQKLKERGECVGDIEGMTVWGRTTTGQSMCLDHVWESIAAEMQILQGQANDWSRKD